MGAREIYQQARLAGYSKEEAADAARNGRLPDDPTAPYWDALLQQESGGRQSAVSPVGAIGIAQVMPGTAPEAAQLAGLNFDENAYRGDADYNAAIGRAYLRKQMQDFGHPDLGLAAYNAGPGRVRQYLAGQATLPAETAAYVPAITNNAEQQPMTPRERFIQLRTQGVDKEQAAAQVRQEFNLAQPQAAAPQPEAQAAPTPAPQAQVPQAAVPQQAPVAQAGAPMGQAPAAPADAQAAQPAQAPMPSQAPAQQPSLLQQLTAKAPGLPAQGSAPQDVGDRAQAAIEDVAPIFANPGRDSWTRYLPQNLLVEATGGAQRGLADTLRGVRQLYNRLTGDEAKVNELNQQQDRSRAFSKEQNAKGTFAGPLGEIIPAAAALIGPQAAASALPGMAGTILGSGTVQGLLGGAIQPTGTKDSVLDNMVVGGGLGAAGDLLTGMAAALGKGRDLAKNNMLPDDALDDFSGRVLGSPRGSDVTPAYQGVGTKLADKADEVQKAFKEAYSKIEGADLPPVTLHPSADANVEFSMSDDLAKLLTPRTRRVLDQVNQSATRTSPIVDQGGRNFTLPQKTTFADVREAMREIKGEMRKLGKLPDREGAVQAKQLRNAMSILDDDLQAWAQQGNGANKAYRAALDLDKQYGEQVVPFFSSKSPIAAVLKKPDEATIGSQLMGENTGMALGDVLTRAPETRVDLRKILGAKLRTARGDLGATRALEGGTTNEALLSKPEREYLLEIAKTIKEGKRSPTNAAMTTGAISGAMIGGPGGAITGGYAGRLIDKALENGQLHRLLHGVRKYGVPEYTPVAAPLTRFLTDRLRNSAIYKTSRDED